MRAVRTILSLLALACALAPAPALAQSPASPCLVGSDKVALAAGVRADTVRDAPECRLTWEQAGVMIGSRRRPTSW